MPIRIITLLFLLVISAPLHATAQRREAAQRRAPSRTTASVPAPEDVLGFRPGDDRKLAEWSSIVEYFRLLDETSDRVRFEELGRSTMGAPFVVAYISAPENLARLAEFRQIQRNLADPRTLSANPEARARRLIERGKTIALVTFGIHSTEVGSTLSSTLVAHRLATSTEEDVQEILRNVIVIMVPSLNPDGVDIVKRWYDRTLGTPYEGSSPPELYQKYVGHDNNRDWYAFTQVETQLTVDKIHNVWRPQIVMDIHQQGIYGARLFIPPYMQPVEPNVPRGIVEGYTELGLAMMQEMRASGLKGITNNSIYDAWTPARAYSHYHGGVRILSETASARLATPVTVKFEELRGGENYDARKASPNFPDVWPGGEWHLRDITNYMTSSVYAMLNHASANRERWLTRFYEIGKEAIAPREAGEVSAFVIPSGGNAGGTATGNLLNILRRGGVEVFRVGARGFVTRGGVRVSTGDYLIPLAQPYGAFAKALLENQRYPDLRDNEGHPIQPYDVTAHTLPLLMGVKAMPVVGPLPANLRLSRAPIPRRFNSVSYSMETDLSRLPVRLGLYKSHVPSMDEGWTRFIFEGHGFKYTSLEDKEVRAGGLETKYDVIVIPDHSPRAILEGHRRGTMPEELTGGLGAEGVRALREFVERGGTLIALNRASSFAIDQLKLPVRDITADFKRTEFFVPGSILRLELDTTHPLAPSKVNREGIAWVEDSPVFEVREGRGAERVRVVARYPANADPLLSGWLLGGEKIRGKAALVDVPVGSGHVYLYGFRPQYRAQSVATYPLLFNAILEKARRPLRPASGNGARR